MIDKMMRGLNVFLKIDFLSIECFHLTYICAPSVCMVLVEV